MVKILISAVVFYVLINLVMAFRRAKSGSIDTYSESRSGANKGWFTSTTTTSVPYFPPKKKAPAKKKVVKKAVKKGKK